MADLLRFPTAEAPDGLELDSATGELHIIKGGQRVASVGAIPGTKWPALRRAQFMACADELAAALLLAAAALTERDRLAAIEAARALLKRVGVL